ncbi:DnaJ domain-containing protein [Pelagibacteraceae bacterium]|nr:DnaJ domain-containing protein [Pelagibacteraceae bacterium]
MKNICEWYNCKEIGKYKAPTEKDNSKKFRLLCSDHIKLFNKNWNYFEGMSQFEIENFLKSDLTWHRPTQKFSSSDNFFNILWNNALSDEFNFFKQAINGKLGINKLSEKDKDAFAIMGLELNSDWPNIQKKFKALVKKLHPDRNPGNKQFEDKLKKITLAYSHLKIMMTKK